MNAVAQANETRAGSLDPVADSVLVGIVDDVYLPLLRGHG